MVVFNIEGEGETCFADTSETSLVPTTVYEEVKGLAVRTELSFPALLKFVPLANGREATEAESAYYRALIANLAC